METMSDKKITQLSIEVSSGIQLDETTYEVVYKVKSLNRTMNSDDLNNLKRIGFLGIYRSPYG